MKGFGLKKTDVDYIIQALRRFPEIKEAIIFGSRAKGNQKPGSDADIAVKGENVDFNKALRRRITSALFF